jgi:hypothetical protein
MPLIVSWDNDDKTAIRVDSPSIWTWEDFDNAVDEAFVMIRSVEHAVSMIITTSSGKAAPKGLPVPHIMRMIRNKPKNAGVAVIVDPRRQERFAARVFAAVLKVRKNAAQQTLYASSLEEARSIITGVRRIDLAQV